MPNQTFYEQPYLGQPFKRVQNEFDVEYGAVTGVKLTGDFVRDGVTMQAWTATIESGIAHAFRFYHSTPTGEWRPLEAAEIATARGAAVLGDVVDKATFLALVERVQALEAMLRTFPVPEPEGAVTAPASTSGGGRASRVAVATG